jgi:hypothetical protein
MKKVLAIFCLVLIVLGVVVMESLGSHRNLHDADLLLYSSGLIGVAIIARRKFMKK